MLIYKQLVYTYVEDWNYSFPGAMYIPLYLCTYVSKFAAVIMSSLDAYIQTHTHMPQTTGISRIQV